jgi:hypothetical protein
MFVSFVRRVQVVWSVISDLLDEGVRMGWTVSKTFGPKLMDKPWMGSFHIVSDTNNGIRSGTICNTVIG